MSYAFAPYQSTPPPPCSGGPRPGVKAFMAYMMDRFGWTSMGIYNCRPPSRHAAGAAWDQGIPVGPGGSARPELGMQAIDLVLRHGKRLGVTLAIYNRKKWGAGYPSGKRYGGRHPHFDHIHWDFTNAAAENLTYATLVAVLGPVTGDGTPDATFRPVLRYGMTGQYVRELQGLLGVDVLGDFGPNTEAAVKAYQTAEGLEVDGIVGAATWAALTSKPKGGEDVIRIIRTTNEDGSEHDGVFVEANASTVKWIPNNMIWDWLKPRAAAGGGKDGPVLVERGEFDTLERIGNAPASVWPE